MAGVKFDITGNANGYIAATRQAEAATKGMVGRITGEAKKIDDIFKTLATGAGTLFTVQMASQFSKQIAQVRGEFQQLEVAFETMLQSKEKADALMAQVVDTAAKTPFDLQGVANGAKQLLAYGVASEEVNDTLIRLGDIAAGLSIPLNDLVYLYGTTMTQGRLFTQDLRQFQGRGIPLADELAKQFGVAKDAVGELVTAGKVGFPEVQKAIVAMTSEGGKFNNLMAKQSQTITGQISNLEDAVSQMFNEIGKASEGAISGAIGLASSLVENYEKVGRLIGGIVTAFGTYKAAIIALNAVDKARTAILAAQVVAQRATAVSAKQVTAATVLWTKAQKALNASMLTNPYVLAAAAVAALGIGIYALVTAKTKEEKAFERVNGQLKSYQENLEKQKQHLQDLFSTMNDSNSTEMQRVLAMEQLRELYPNVLKDLSDEELLKLSVAEATKELVKQEESLYRSDLLKRIADKTAEYEKQLNILKTGGYGGLLGAASAKKQERDIEALRYELELLLQQYNDIEAASKKADFLALPADQKIISLKDSNAQLDAEIAELDGKLKKLHDKKSEIEKEGPIEFKLGSNQGFLYQGMTEEQILAEIKVKQAQKKQNDKDIAENQAKVDADNKSLSDKQKKANYDRQKAEQKAAEDLAKMKRDLNNKVAQADIDSMEDGYAKTIRQLEHNLDLENQAIEQQKKDLLKRKENDALQSWLAEDPENRKAYDFKYTATLSSEEQRLFQDMGRHAQAQFDKGYKEAAEKWENEAKFFMHQKEIDSMSDGSSKEAAQRQLDNEMELHQLEMQRDAFIEAARAAHLLAVAKGEASGAFNEEKANADFDKIVEDTKISQKKEETEELLRKYEDYASGILRIEKELNADLAKMRDSDGNPLSGFSQKNIDIAIKQAEDAKDALAVSFAAETAEFNVFVSTLADKTMKQLTLMLAEAEIELSTLEDMGGADSDELARARAEVAKLKEALKKLNIDKGVEKSQVNWTELNEVLSDSVNAFSELGEIIPGVSGQILSGIGTITSSAISMANGIKTIGAEVSAAEKASAILAVISAAIQVVQFFTSAVEKNQQANADAEKAAMEYANALKEIAANERRDQYDGVFGENSLGLFIENVKIAKEQIEDLKKETDKGSGWDAGDMFAMGMNSSGWSTFSKKYQSKMKEIGQAGSMALVSDMRSGWQKFWGTGNNNLNVVSLEDFIDEDGLLDSERLREWYKAYGAGLSDEQKNIVENLLNGWDAYYETLEQMDSYVSSLFGNTIENIADSWIEAFDKTGSAITDLSEISNDFAKSFAKDMLKNILATEVFNEANTQALLDIMKSGDSEAATRFYSGLVKQAEDLGNVANTILQTTGAMSDAERSSSSKGIAQASQSSIDELSGRATNIQSHTFSIHNDMKAIINLNTQILASVRNIEGNTERLEAIESNIILMETNISDMVTKGIRVRA